MEMDAGFFQTSLSIIEAHPIIHLPIIYLSLRRNHAGPVQGELRMIGKSYVAFYTSINIGMPI
jgi:hypothetical protein